MDFNIHQADKEEALQMNDLLTKLIQDEKQYDDTIDPNFIVVSFYEQYIEDKNKCLLVATKEKMVVGYLYGYIKNPEGGTIDVFSAKLDALFVSEEYRKQHIAKDLIDNFKTWCKDKNVTSLEVDVCSENNKALNLYKQAGFEEFKKSLKMDIN